MATFTEEEVCRKAAESILIAFGSACVTAMAFANLMQADDFAENGAAAEIIRIRDRVMRRYAKRHGIPNHIPDEGPLPGPVSPQDIVALIKRQAGL